MKLKITLCDLNVDLVRAWSGAMPDGVECALGDIFQHRADALVSPANSFGFMDGGIDLVYSRRIGWHVQERVQAKIRDEFGGELLVGQALSVATDNEQFPILVSAPTMRVPAPIRDLADVRLSTRAAVRCAVQAGAGSLVMPGMGTLTGQVSPEDAAIWMRAGIRDALDPKPFPSTLSEAYRDHFAPIPASQLNRGE